MYLYYLYIQIRIYLSQIRIYQFYSIFISSFPFSCINIISNDFLVINEINNITKYIKLADLITILGYIDFVLGSVDLIRTILHSIIKEGNVILINSKLN